MVHIWYLQMSISVPFFPWRKCKKLSLNEDSSTLSWWLLINSLISAILKPTEIVFLTIYNHKIELTPFSFRFFWNSCEFWFVFVSFCYDLIPWLSGAVVAEHSWTEKLAEINSLNSRNLSRICMFYGKQKCLCLCTSKPRKFKSKNVLY